MKIFDLKSRLKDAEEVILGYEDTGSHACYLIYGVMAPKEKGRKLNPGTGHEELVLILKGQVSLSGDMEGTVGEGQAIHLVGQQLCYMDNATDEEVIYVIAGGHSEGGHH